MLRRCRNHAILLAARSAILALLVCIPPASAASQETWRISATPSVSIGGESRGPVDPIFGVAGLVTLSDGRIVVADQAQRLLLFDGNGRYVRTFGRKGGGPGEFSTIVGIQLLPNDTMMVFDYTNRRISYFSDEGFGRSVAIPAGSSPTIVGVLRDGTLLGTRVSDPGSASAGDGVRWIRMQRQLFRFNAAGQVLNILGTFPEPANFLIPIGGGRSVATMMGGPESPVPWTSVVVDGGQVYVTTSEDFEIMVYPPEGGNPRTIRRTDYAARPLVEADLIRLFSESSINDDIDVAWDRIPWNIPRGSSVSAISSLLVDTEGNVWAEEGPWVSGRPRAWSVFTASGRHLAQVVMPPRFRPFEIRAESVLGVWRDELDVEHVQIRPLNRISNN